MQFIRFLMLTAFGSLLLCGCDRQSAGDPRAEAEAIQERSHQWTSAIVSRDVDGILQCYAPDAVQMQSGFPALVGHDAIRAWYRTWITDTTLSYSASTIGIEVAASLDLAYERGTYSFSESIPNGRVKEVGKYVTIWRKIQGKWKAVVDTGTPDT
jgi:ketosteroid isomerase-like protein